MRNAVFRIVLIADVIADCGTPLRMSLRIAEHHCGCHCGLRNTIADVIADCGTPLRMSLRIAEHHCGKSAIEIGVYHD